MNPTTGPQYSGNIPPEAAAGIFAVLGGLMIFFFLLLVIVYVIAAISLMKIAHRTNTPNAWFAWIPILNVILMIQIAQRPLWWIILFLVPIVNFILSFVIWVDIAKRLGKSPVFGILAALIPIIFMPYLAFSKSDSPVQ